MNRRQFLHSAAGAAATVVLGRPAIAQGTGPQLVLVGGGFGGASCARALKRLGPNLSVTLVEPNPVYTAMPMSNTVIAGMRNLAQQQFKYDGLRRAGVQVASTRVTAIDPAARSMTLSNGTKLNYAKLVIAPGIDFRWDAIEGYGPSAATIIPHAWKDAEQVALLRRQLEAMHDGGTVVISVPVNPARCPPAPYERASLIAHYLKTKKPRSKVIVLDAKESFTMQKLFEQAWKTLYPGLIEWVSVSVGGSMNKVDVTTRTLSTDFDEYHAAVANIIPPQKAGEVATLAAVADHTGWCPVDPVTFESKLQKDVHVIGDAALAGAMPRSASAAHSQAEICAAAIVSMLAGHAPAAPTLTSSCYSLIAPDYAISQFGTFRPAGDQYSELAGGASVSPINAPSTLRRDEAESADTWYRSFTSAVFG